MVRWTQNSPRNHQSIKRDARTSCSGIPLGCPHWRTGQELLLSCDQTRAVCNLSYLGYIPPSGSPHGTHTFPPSSVPRPPNSFRARKKKKEEKKKKKKTISHQRTPFVPSQNSVPQLGPRWGSAVTAAPMASPPSAPGPDTRSRMPPVRHLLMTCSAKPTQTSCTRRGG